jgi:ribonuclease HII
MITIRRNPNFKKLMFEKEAWGKNQLVCGIDEVGRSCLAGPVVAAAVILKPNTSYKYLKDSKILSPEERLKAYKWINKNCDYAVGIMHHRIIDSINIYQATVCAMKRAVYQLIASSRKDLAAILVDFVPLKLDIDIPVIHFSKGESKSSSIAAASIVAKVTRDRLMSRMDSFIPGYSFKSNKGYGTCVHRKAINCDGISFCHRLSFSFNNENKFNLIEE